jgi:hypothetical protein
LLMVAIMKVSFIKMRFQVLETTIGQMVNLILEIGRKTKWMAQVH